MARKKKKKPTQTNGVELLPIRVGGRAGQVITHKKKYTRKKKHKNREE